MNPTDYRYGNPQFFSNAQSVPVDEDDPNQWNYSTCSAWKHAQSNSPRSSANNQSLFPSIGNIPPITSDAINNFANLSLAGLYSDINSYDSTVLPPNHTSPLPKTPIFWDGGQALNLFPNFQIGSAQPDITCPSFTDAIDGIDAAIPQQLPQYPNDYHDDSNYDFSMLSGYGIPPMDVRIGGLYSHGLQQLNFNELLMTNPLPSIPLPSIPEQPYAHPHPETLRARVDQNSPEESHVSVEEGKEKKMTSYNRSKTNVVRREKTICGVCKFKKCSCDQPLPCTECRRIYRENAERICIPYHRGWSELRECLYQSRLIPKPATNGESGSRLVIHHDPQLVAELTPKVHQNATMEPPVPRLSVLEIETYCIRQERHVAYDALLSQTMDGFIDHGEFIIRFKDHVDLGNLESAIINYCFMYQVQNPDANTQVRNLIDSMLTLFNIEGDCLVELDGDERFRMQHGAIKINEEFTPRPSARALSQLSERLSKLRGSLLSKVMEGLEEITHGIIEKKIAQDSSCVPVEFCAELLILYCRNKVQQYQESSTQRSCYQKVVDYFSLQHWSLKRPRKLAPAQFEMLLLGRIRKLEDLYYKEENGSSIDAVHRELMKSSKKRRPGKHGGPKNKNEQKTDNHNNSQSVVHSSQNQHRHTQRQRNRRQKRLNQTQIEGAQMFNYEIFCCTPIPMANTEVAETLHGRMETDDRNNNGHYYNMTGTHDLGECVNAKCTIQ